MGKLGWKVYLFRSVPKLEPWEKNQSWRTWVLTVIFVTDRPGWMNQPVWKSGEQYGTYKWRLGNIHQWTIENISHEVELVLGIQESSRLKNDSSKIGSQADGRVCPTQGESQYLQRSSSKNHIPKWTKDKSRYELEGPKHPKGIEFNGYLE